MTGVNAAHDHFMSLRPRNAQPTLFLHLTRWIVDVHKSTGVGDRTVSMFDIGQMKTARSWRNRPYAPAGLTQQCGALG